MLFTLDLKVLVKAVFYFIFYARHCAGMWPSGSHLIFRATLHYLHFKYEETDSEK